MRGVCSDFLVLCGGNQTDSDESGENRLSGCSVGLDPVEVRRTNGAPGKTHCRRLTTRPLCVCVCVPNMLYDGGGALAWHHS